ncbi:hypothetical protein OC834_003596 [Tilletia horrida]|nr:hypothetical protein OC834_003596 [Tilletia horrida]
MPPRQTISFSGGPLPPFLARMQAQVGGGGASSSSTSSDPERHFDPLLEARRKAKREEIEERRRKRAEGGGPREGEEDEDDEFDGAQIVVLDEAKDLSREQALKGEDSVGKGSSDASRTAQPASTSSASGSIAIPGTKRKADDTVGASSTKNGSNGLDALAEEVAKRKKTEQKEKERKEKNKRAAKEKKKAGKGLSFEM